MDSTLGYQKLGITFLLILNLILQRRNLETGKLSMIVAHGCCSVLPKITKSVIPRQDPKAWNWISFHMRFDIPVAKYQNRQAEHYCCAWLLFHAARNDKIIRILKLGIGFDIPVAK